MLHCRSPAGILRGRRRPVFVTNSRWSYDDASALSSPIFFATAPSAFDFATQIGTSAVVTAVSACAFARRADVPPEGRITITGRVRLDRVDRLGNKLQFSVVL